MAGDVQFTIDADHSKYDSAMQYVIAQEKKWHDDIIKFEKERGVQYEKTTDLIKKVESATKEVTVATDKNTDALKKIKTTYTELNNTIQVVERVYRTVQKVISETVGEYIEYADQVRTLTQVTGASAQQTSRLIQLADDHKVSVENLTTAMRTMSTQGHAVTIESLGKMSDEYLTLNAGIERQQFLMKNFGRAGVEFAEMMLMGSDAIKAESEAINDNLILTDKALKQARDYEKAEDELNDAWMALKITAGQYLVPALTALVQGFAGMPDPESLAGKWNTWNEEIKETTGNVSLLYRILNQPPKSVEGGRGSMLPYQEYATAAAELSEETARLAEEEAKLALELYNQETAWMSTFEGATTAKEQAKVYFDYIEQSFDTMGQQGAEVWRGYLMATGKLSEESIAEFIRVETALARIKGMIDSGAFDSQFLINIAIQLLGGATGGGGGSGGGYTGPTASFAPPGYVFQGYVGATPETGSVYKNPDTGEIIVVPFKASGGSVGGRYALVGDAPGGRMTPYTELVDFANKRVYNAKDTRKMLGGLRGVPMYASGSSGSGPLGSKEPPPPPPIVQAVISSAQYTNPTLPPTGQTQGFTGSGQGTSGNPNDTTQGIVNQLQNIENLLARQSVTFPMSIRDAYQGVVGI